LVFFTILKIKTELAKKLLLKMLCSLIPLFLVFFSDPDCFMTRSTIEMKNEVIIPEISTFFKLFCFQTVTTPTLASSLLAHIVPPSTLRRTTWFLLTWMGFMCP
jgi:hypothetical protein